MGVSRLRLNSVSSTGGPNSPDEANSDDECAGGVRNENEQKNTTKLKHFFKNLIGIGGNHRKAAAAAVAVASSNPNLNGKRNGNPKMDGDVSESPMDILDPEISPRDRAHRFWALDSAQQETAFEEYRKNTSSFVTSPQEFRDLFRVSVESGDFNGIGDFYNWLFSNSANMTSLFLSEKSVVSDKPRPVERKYLDACVYVSMNWRFLKEIYNCLVKMVIYYNFQLIFTKLTIM